MKNPLTPAGIEPATFRFVAQHLNHCATAGYQIAGIYASLLYSIYLLSLYYNSVFQSGDYTWSYTLLPLPLFVNQPPY
jgi:hypothetical protein